MTAVRACRDSESNDEHIIMSSISSSMRNLRPAGSWELTYNKMSIIVDVVLVAQFLGSMFESTLICGDWRL